MLWFPGGGRSPCVHHQASESFIGVTVLALRWPFLEFEELAPIFSIDISQIYDGVVVIFGFLRIAVEIEIFDIGKVI